jgi:uncharacterized membrane protein
MISIFNAFGFLVVIVSTLCLFHAKSNKKIIFFFVAVLYSLIVEEMGAGGYRPFHLVPGYTYSQDFIINFWHVPAIIPFMWASIIYSVMEISNKLDLSAGSRPFFDAILAMLIDVSEDPIAIRFGLWNWDSNNGFLGVPYMNFEGWLGIVFSISLFWRFLNKEIPLRNLFYLSIFILLKISDYMKLLQGNELIALSITILIFMFFITKNTWNKLKLNNRFDFVLLVVPIGINGFFLFFLLLKGSIFPDFPLLLILSISIIFITCAIYLLPSYRLIFRKNRSNIYAGR